MKWTGIFSRWLFETRNFITIPIQSAVNQKHYNLYYIARNSRHSLSWFPWGAAAAPETEFKVTPTINSYLSAVNLPSDWSTCIENPHRCHPATHTGSGSCHLVTWKKQIRILQRMELNCRQFEQFCVCRTLYGLSLKWTGEAWQANDLPSYI